MEEEDDRLACSAMLLTHKESKLKNLKLDEAEKTKEVLIKNRMPDLYLWSPGDMGPKEEHIDVYMKKKKNHPLPPPPYEPIIDTRCRWMFSDTVAAQEKADEANGFAEMEFEVTDLMLPKLESVEMMPPNMWHIRRMPLPKSGSRLILPERDMVSWYAKGERRTNCKQRGSAGKARIRLMLKNLKLDDAEKMKDKTRKENLKPDDESIFSVADAGLEEEPKKKRMKKVMPRVSEEHIQYMKKHPLPRPTNPSIPGIGCSPRFKIWLSLKKRLLMKSARGSSTSTTTMASPRWNLRSPTTKTRN